MTIDILMAKTLSNQLRPTDDVGRDAIAAVGKREVLVTIKQPRSAPQHRLFFATLNLVFKNQREQVYPSLDHLLDAVKIALGYFHEIKLLDGRVIPRPDSIAFHAMGGPEFTEFHRRFKDLIVTKFIPGLDMPDLERELLEMTN